MSLGLLGEYGSDSSSDTGDSPKLSPRTPSSITTECAHTSKQSGTDKSSTQSLSDTPTQHHITHKPSHTTQDTPYDPFGFTTTIADSSSSDSEHSTPPTPPPSEDFTLPLPDLEAMPNDREKSSVFSNPYKEAEEERLSILKHHVKEFAPEVKEERKGHRRGRGKRRGFGRRGGGLGMAKETLFDDNDSSSATLGRRKIRCGVGDSLAPAKKFVKLHNQLQAKERPWTQ